MTECIRNVRMWDLDCEGAFLWCFWCRQAGIMGPQAVKVDDVEFSAKLTPPSSSTALELMGYGEFGVIVFTALVRPHQSLFNCCKPHQ